MLTTNGPESGSPEVEVDVEERRPASTRRISIFGLGYVGAVSLACLARDGHRVVGVDIDPVKLDLIRARAQDYYGGDRACPGWEPGGDEFISPALTEALLMRRTLPAPAFSAWFEAFLPDLAAGKPAALFTPAFVSDRSDGKIAHLDGVNLSRAWCWRGIADALEPEAAALARATADAHLDASLPYVAGDYAGEHWLATFALLALLKDD